MGKIEDFGGDSRSCSGFAGRMEIRESATGRREWPDAVKDRILRENLESGASVKDVARRHAITPRKLTTRRRAAREGGLALLYDPIAEDNLGFAPLVVADEPGLSAPMDSAAPASAVDLVMDGVVIRFDGETPVLRIVRIAAALGTPR